MVASENIIPGINKTELVTIGPIEFGKIWRKIKRQSLAPKVRDARTYSLRLYR